jgi:DNA-binding transcriptional LysR family regulator
MMDLRELRAFVAVVEEGGISAAARRLHVSQPTLSHTINVLERELGLTLLVRTNTGVEATEAGTALLREAHAILARHDGAVQRMAVLATQDRGVIRLGIPIEVPHCLLPRVLPTFRSQCPEVRIDPIHLSTSAQLAALRSGQLDVGLVSERPTWPGLDSTLVARENMGVLIAAELGDGVAGPDGIPLEALAGLQWVAFPRSHAPAWYDEITAIMHSHGIDVAPAAPDGHELISAVKFVAVAGGHAFALSAEKGGPPIPDQIGWFPLTGHAIVKRTWIVWPANSSRRDVGEFVAAFETATQT